VCLVGIAVDSHPAYPLIVVGNRDEIHDRPAAAADWWPDDPGVFSGRDLVAGGSWLGVNRKGCMAVVTNYPGRDLAPGDRASRGDLVRDYLTRGERPAEFLAALKGKAADYAGFCLILHAPGETWVMTSPAEKTPGIQRLSTGIFTVSNSPLVRPWPKCAFLKDKIAEIVRAEHVAKDPFFDLLARQEPVVTANPAQEPVTPWFASTPFVLDSQYGTRASTVLIIRNDGQCLFSERRFDRAGQYTGQSETCFAVS
jgi:uncharacterized protein with NRDE domain